MQTYLNGLHVTQKDQSNISFTRWFTQNLCNKVNGSEHNARNIFKEIRFNILCSQTLVIRNFATLFFNKRVKTRFQRKRFFGILNIKFYNFFLTCCTSSDLMWNRPMKLIVTSDALWHCAWWTQNAKAVSGALYHLVNEIEMKFVLRHGTGMR